MGECRQADLDAWGGTTLSSVCQAAQPFIIWAVRRRLTPDLDYPKRKGNGGPNVVFGDGEWALARHLLHDTDIDPHDRAAGLLVVLYAQNVTRISQLIADDVTTNGNTVELRLGVTPLRLASPMADHPQSAAAATPAEHRRQTGRPTHWLFPGQHPGRHTHSTVLAVRLRAIRVRSSSARPTALANLAATMPAVIIADLLGISAHTAVTWADASDEPGSITQATDDEPAFQSVRANDGRSATPHGWSYCRRRRFAAMMDGVAGEGTDAILPRYGVAGWPEGSGLGYATVGGSIVHGGGGADSIMSIGVRYQATDGSIQVSSHRAAHDSPEGLRRQLIAQTMALSGTPPLGHGLDWDSDPRYSPNLRVWTSVVIPVDDTAVTFAVAAIGDGWAAIGQGPQSSIITIASHRVAIADLALVRLADAIPRSFERRPPRPRRFPDREPDAATTGPDNVLLSLANKRLTGTVDGVAVDVDIDIPHSHSTARGAFAGSELFAAWRLGDNSTEYPDVAGSLEGGFAGLAVKLAGIFHLDEDWAIERADITGDIGGEPIDGRVEALDGGLSDTNTVGVDGHFAGTTFTVSATISADMSGGMIRGRVDDKPIRLDARVEPGRNAIHLTGRYDGPPALLAVIVSTYLFFE